jgi:hypothetical protein
MKVDPNNAIAWIKRGRVEYLFREPNQSVPFLNEAIRLSPRLAVAYNSRGNARR